MSVWLSELPYFAQRVLLYAGTRYLTRKVIEKVLGPTVARLAAADPKLPLAKPSVQFDVYQRAARAIYALIIIARCWQYLSTDHSAEIAVEASKHGWPAVSPDHIDYALQPVPLSGRTITYDMIGWYLTDSLDLFLLKRRYGVKQWDLYFHHAVGLLLVPYFIFANRGLNILIADLTGEALVPVGFLLWWLKATGSKSPFMIVVRLLGLFVLAVYRMGLWTRNILFMLFTSNWAFRTGALTDPASIFFTFIHCIGYWLDVGWIKLYLDGFRAKAE